MAGFLNRFRYITWIAVTRSRNWRSGCAGGVSEREEPVEPKLMISVRRVAKGAAALEIVGELTRLAEKPLDAAVAEAIAGGARGIILDFRGLTYMNNKGVGLLVRLEARLRGQGRRLAVIGLNDHYRRVFRTTGLDEGIRVYETEAHAVEAVQGNA